MYPHLLKSFPQFVVIHKVKGFSVVNEAEVDDLLERYLFFYDPMDVGNLISGSSAFSKSSLHIWKFSVHVLLKPNLEDFTLLACGLQDKILSREKDTLLLRFINSTNLFT